MLVVCGAAVTMFMAITNVLSALPEIAEDIPASQRELQWAADCYPLALATLLLPAGVLADRFGRKRFLLVGLTLLTAGLLLASQVGSPAGLLLGIGLAGVGSGLGFPSTLATVTGAAPPARRSLAISIWAAAVPVGGLAGAVLTGAIVEVATWRWAFGATALCAGMTLVAAALFVSETRDPRNTALDVPGAVLSAGAVALLVLGITEGPIAGWGDPLTLAWFGASAALLGAFVSWELHAERPLLDVRLFAIPAFAASVGAMFLMFGGLFGMVYLCYQWEAYVLDFNTLVSGLGLAPMAILMIPLAILGSRIAARISVRWAITIAMTAGVAGALVYAWAGQTEAYWTAGLAAVVFGACIGLSAGPGTEAISSPLPPSRQGVASAVNDLARELGATLGIAVSGTAFSAAYRHEVRDRLDVSSDPVAQAILPSPAAGERALTRLGGDGGPQHEILVSAVSAGFTAGALAIAVALAAGAILFVVAYPRPSRA